MATALACRPRMPQKGQAVSILCLDGAHHRRRSEHPKGRRIPAGDIEGLVLDRLRALFASDAEVSDAVAPLGLDAATQRAVLDRSAKLAERWTRLASLELRELVQSLVQQIQIGEAQISIWLNRTAIVSSVMPDAAHAPIDFGRPSNLWSCRSPPAFAGRERACGW